MEEGSLSPWGKVPYQQSEEKMTNWGNFSEQSYSDFLNGISSPTNYMVVAPALASRAAMAPESFFMDEEGEYDDEEEEDYGPYGYEDEEDEDEDEETNAAMAMGQLRSMAEDIMLILSEMTPEDNLEPWVAAKITMSKQNLSAVSDYLRFND